MNKEWRVMWVIDILAETPEDAALKAYAIQQDEESIATVFNVREKAKPNGQTFVIDVEVPMENMRVN